MTNTGPSEAQNVTVTDPVPASTIFVSATSAAGWTPTTPPVGGTGDIIFSKTLVQSGETADFRIVVRVRPDDPAPTISNTATITSSTTDPDTSNNTVTVVQPLIT